LVLIEGNGHMLDGTSLLPLDEAVERAAEMVLEAEYVVALCGAGVSVESGVPSFWGPDGLWGKLGAPSLKGYRMFLDDPVSWWRQQVDRAADPARTAFRDAIERALPNPGHIAIAEMERMGVLRYTITQNVDGLHQAVGGANVIEIHGNRKKIRCIGCERRWPRDEFHTDDMPPRCPDCNALVKTDTVMFGEPVPRMVLDRCYEEVERCDLLLSIGTSAKVFPAANLPNRVLAAGGAAIEINTAATRLSPRAGLVLRGCQCSMTLSVLLLSDFVSTTGFG